MSIIHFLYSTFQLDPKPLDTLNVKKGPIQGSICFKLVPRFLVLGPLFKMAPNCAKGSWNFL
jgi:hypothetical protein